MKTSIFKIAILLTLFVALLYTTSVSKRLIEKNFATNVNRVAITQLEENNSYMELQILKEKKDFKLNLLNFFNVVFGFGFGALVTREIIYIWRKMNEKSCVGSADSSSSN